MNIHTHPQKHTHTLKSKHNTILCSCRHSFDTITFLRVIMNLFRKLDCGNRWVWPRIHPQAENGWERKLRVSLCTPVREMPLPLYLSPSLAVFHDPVFSPPPSQTTRSFPLSLSRSLTLPLLRLISEVHWNPGKLFQHLRSVRVLWRTFWMCWCVQTVTLPADMALHHTICQRLQVNSATQAQIMDGASSKRQSYNSVPQFVSALYGAY